MGEDFINLSKSHSAKEREFTIVILSFTMDQGQNPLHKGTPRQVLESRKCWVYAREKPRDLGARDRASPFVNLKSRTTRGLIDSVDPSAFAA